MRDELRVTAGGGQVVCLIVVAELMKMVCAVVMLDCTGLEGHEHVGRLMNIEIHLRVVSLTIELRLMSNLIIGSLAVRVGECVSQLGAILANWVRSV